MKIRKWLGNDESATIVVSSGVHANLMELFVIEKRLALVSLPSVVVVASY